MTAILARPDVGEGLSGQVCQDEDVIEIPKGEQSSVGRPVRRHLDPKVGYGGFGGGACRATKTLVVFIHGNGDRAINWASPVVGTVEGYVPPKRSVYDEFRRRGYNDCGFRGHVPQP